MAPLLLKRKTTLVGFALDRNAAKLLAFMSLAMSGFCAVLLLSYARFSPVCGPGCLEGRLQAMVRPDGAVQTNQLNQASILIRRELHFSPMDISAWLRQAALASQVAGRLSPAAQHALVMSYRWAPVDATVARWRLAFVFEHWDQLDPPLRASAINEIQGLMVAPANEEILRQIQPTIRNPAGRLACQLLTANRLVSEATGGG